MNIQLDTSVQYVPRVGPAMAQRLEKLGIRSVRDLVFYPPFRYNDFSTISTISRIIPKTTVTIYATVTSIKNIFTKNGKKIQEAIVRDHTGILTVIWFNQLYLPKIIHKDDRISFSGSIGFFGNKLVMESPEYEIMENENYQSLHTGRLVPVYSETAGVSSKWLRGRIAHLLSQKETFLHELLPEHIIRHHSLMGISEALGGIHFPKNKDEADKSRHRLAFDELFFLQLTSNIQKKRWEYENLALPFNIDNDDIQTFIKHLPFTLTHDQLQAIHHICSDLKRPYPMNRLLEGDVGSGKTVVAAFLLYLSQKNGYTSVLMAPTQILAEQHFLTIQHILKPFSIPVTLVLGGSKSKSHTPQKNTRTHIRDTKSNTPATVFIGTHALIQEKLELHNVGAVIIDEQQRFGVDQRSIIRTKGAGNNTPHFFTMTATPIPRTLALTAYGNLDLSILSDMPHGRIPIKTWVVPQEKRTKAYEWIRMELQKNNCRVFLVCPFIEESESMSTIKAAKKEFEYLKTQVFPDISIGLLHGKMKANEKTSTLDAFREGKTKILVTTPVVEVGIDIKEASIMLIEGAERFGLSQLHQLRGRVGRGTFESYCLLFTTNTDPHVLERLKILEKVHNGPELAEYDLALRGEGDILGFRQHGLPPLALASLKDKKLVVDTQEAVHTILDTDPTLQNFPLLREHVDKGIIAKGIQD